MSRLIVLLFVGISVSQVVGANDVDRNNLEELIAGNESLVSSIPAFEARYTVINEYGDLDADNVESDGSIQSRFRKELANAKSINKVHFRSDGNIFMATQSVTFYSEHGEVLQTYVRRVVSDGTSMRAVRDRPDTPSLYTEIEFEGMEDPIEAMEEAYREQVSFDIRDYWGRTGDSTLSEVIRGKQSADTQWDITLLDDGQYLVSAIENNAVRTQLTVDASQGYLLTSAKAFGVNDLQKPAVELTVTPGEVDGNWYPQKIVIERSLLKIEAEVEMFRICDHPITHEETSWEGLGVDINSGIYVRHLADGTVERVIPEDLPKLLSTN